MATVSSTSRANFAGRRSYPNVSNNIFAGAASGQEPGEAPDRL